MSIAGIGPSIFTLIVVWLSFPTWGAIVYPELATFPDWAREGSNNTAVNTTMAALTNITSTTSMPMLENVVSDLAKNITDIAGSLFNSTSLTAL